MTTAYTSLLGLALPVTGELDGTWGDTVNDYITEYVDASVAGAQTISGNQTTVTLSTTNGSALTQVASGSTGSSQYQIINCTGNPASLLTITAPATSKTYIIVNATSTNQQVKLVGAGPTTGVTVNPSERAVVAWNGSDFVKVASGFLNIPYVTDKTTSYSITPADVGRVVGVGTGGSITIPDATFSSGDAVLIFNNTTGSITITCTITTAYIAGTDLDKATVSLATRGVANILFVSGTVCVITGNVS